MLFNSITFIVFFTLIMILHYSRISWNVKKINLLIGSYIFYAAWNPPFILLLFLSTIVDWKVAKKIDESPSHKIRKRWLVISLSFNLGILSIFKYSCFILENFQNLLSVFGFSFQSFDPGIILPMGISFYTFQTLSYTIDVYNKKLKTHHSFLDYALFVSFFPQLVAGPIVRAKDFLPQLRVQNHINFDQFSLGLSLLIIGLFTKTVLADAFFAPFVDKVFASTQAVDTLSSWLAGVFFYAQIFSDFAGYSLCAIGTALMLGFVIPLNFRAPFAAHGFSDFWRRWHISLSSWLRDYLYIPLGGNRKGKTLTFRNLMITMLLGGLWHGAAWTFVIWGAIHGFYLIAERWIRSIPMSGKITDNLFFKLIISFMTFILVMIAFVVFRAENLNQANSIILSMFKPTNGESIIQWTLWTQVVTCTFVTMFILQYAFRNRSILDLIVSLPVTIRAIYLSLCIILISISSGNSDAFIYFQF